MAFNTIYNRRCGFNKSPTNLGKLIKQAGVGLALLAYKANGSTKGINSPFINPWVDVANAVKKNLFDTNAPYTSVGTGIKQLIPNGIKIVGNPINQVSYINMPYSLLPNTQYRIQAIETVINGSSRIGVRNSLGAGIGDLLVTGSIAFTTDETGNGFFYIYANRDIFTASTEVNYTNIQLELGSTPTTYEPYAKNNALLTNFAATEADGWVDKLLPNGNTKPMLKYDAINSYGILPNNPSIDIVGLDEFEITRCFMTSSVITTGQLILKTLDGTTATAQYGTLALSDGSMAVDMGGASTYIVSIGTLIPNKVYVSTLRRRAGRLIHYLNGIETYNQPNTSVMVTQPNFRIGARCNNANGLSHTLYSDVFDGGTMITKNPQDWSLLDKVTEMAFRGVLR